MSHWINHLQKFTYVFEEPKIPQKASHWTNHLPNLTYVFEGPKVPQKLSHYINHLLYFAYVFEEQKVPQKLSYWVSFIKQAAHVFVRRVSNANEGHDKDMGHKLVQLQQKLDENSEHMATIWCSKVVNRVKHICRKYWGKVIVRKLCIAVRGRILARKWCL